MENIVRKFIFYRNILFLQKEPRKIEKNCIAIYNIFNPKPSRI